MCLSLLDKANKTLEVLNNIAHTSDSCYEDVSPTSAQLKAGNGSDTSSQEPASFYTNKDRQGEALEANAMPMTLNHTQERLEELQRLRAMESSSFDNAEDVLPPSFTGSTVYYLLVLR